MASKDTNIQKPKPKRRIHKHKELPQEQEEDVKKFSFKRLVKRTLLIIVALLLISVSWLGWKVYSDASKITGNKNPLSLFGIFRPTSLKQTNGRVNILLTGYSADDGGHEGAELTDSIMILSINLSNKSAVVISVPRDLYVDIPGYGYSKINAAYEYGEASKFSQSGYDPGGIGLLEETLSEDFDVNFNYYALINYTAFKSAVDAVGGVKVTINSPDPRGLYDPNTNLDIPNGLVNLNGQQALNLARARGDGYGSFGFTSADFDRTQHQQELLIALKDKTSKISVISNPLKIGAIADALGNNIKTSMSIGEMETLYFKTKGVKDQNIKTVTLNNYNGKNLLKSFTTRDGQSALIPTTGLDDYSAIQAVVQTLLGK